MSGGFSFPPPPPPPPKASAGDVSGQESYLQGRGRGRGQGRGNGGFRGTDSRQGYRGAFRGRGNQHSSDNSVMNHVTNNSYQRTPAVPISSSGPHISYDSKINLSSTGNGHLQTQPDYPVQQHMTTTGWPSRTAAGHKRKLDALRGAVKEKKPALPIVPATPSFGSFTAPSKDVGGPSDTSLRTLSSSIGGRGNHKSLGLTPAAEGPQYSSSEDDNEETKDMDEEALYAELGDKLTFEHNGVVMSLASQADLEIWKKERQRNWPTKARAMEKEEERRVVGEERRRLLASSILLRRSPKSVPSSTWTKPEGESLNSNNAEQPLMDSHQTEKEKAKTALDEQTQKLVELRKKVAESEARNRRARVSLEQSQGANVRSTCNTGDSQTIAEDVVVNEPEAGHNIEEPESIHLGLPERSSSPIASSVSSPDSDSDDAPPEKIATKPQIDLTSRSKKLCRYFSASGHCRDGDSCGFRHEQSEKAFINSGSTKDQNTRSNLTNNKRAYDDTAQKRTIFERLMDQERDDETRLALQVIKYLGTSGFFRVESGVDHV